MNDSVMPAVIEHVPVLTNLADATGAHPLAPFAAAVRARMVAADFPCTFVRGAVNKHSIYCAHVDPADETCVPDAHALIGRYLERVDACPTETEAAMTVLLLDVEVTAGSGPDAVRDLAWNLLRQLHEYDVRSGRTWPSFVPTDIEDTSWAYCLHGVRLFVNMTSSALVLRHSRDLGRPLVLVVQPTGGLHYIAPLDESGDRIRDRIRDRIDSYDAIPHSPALSNAGAEGNSDWRQFWLGDSNDGSDWTPPAIPATSCPYRHTAPAADDGGRSGTGEVLPVVA
ncbi:YqcI/YcgG family protein [Streptomyces sp. NPDC020983]|uniref:YqcI/YcgG family protein n=1 Tax=Streptomyces sp. NPDC020983 TaxID=3365106 RepID=UPI0037A16604